MSLSLPLVCSLAGCAGALGGGSTRLGWRELTVGTFSTPSKLKELQKQRGGRNERVGEGRQREWRVINITHFPLPSYSRFLTCCLLFLLVSLNRVLQSVGLPRLAAQLSEGEPHSECSAVPSSPEAADKRDARPPIRLDLLSHSRLLRQARIVSSRAGPRPCGLARWPPLLAQLGPRLRRAG